MAQKGSYRESNRNRFRTAIAQDSYENDYENSRKFVEQETSAPRRGRGQRRGGHGQNRSGYQATRVQNFRIAQNRITEHDLSEELRKRLFPGVKNSQTAMERLEAVSTLKAITLTVTTRAIGLGSANVFYALYEFNQVPIRGTVYQLYRICLAIFEVKVKICQRSITAIQNNESDYADLVRSEDMISVIKSVSVLPDQISETIKCLGKVKVGDELFVPKMARDSFDRNGNFIPQSENVRFSNLRQVVVSLGMGATPAEYRRRFYRHCPIPGAIWDNIPDNPILINVDEICPENYDIQAFSDDVADIQAKINYLCKKAPKYSTRPISYEPEGTKSLLTCNRQGDLRLPDRGVDEQLPDYYQRLRPQGDIDEYFNLRRLNCDEQVSGCLSLLGEVPVTPALEFPIFCPRNERNCVERCSLKYRAVYNVKYT